MMRAGQLTEGDTAPALRPAARLLLRRALPRLAKHLDRIRDALARYDAADPATLGDLTWIPGSEVLATLLVMDSDARDIAVAQAALSEAERASLRAALTALGDPADPKTAAAALIRAFPDAAQVYEGGTTPQLARPETGSGVIEYRLLLDRGPEGIEAVWEYPGGRGPRFPLIHGMTREDRAEHSWYLEAYPISPGPGDHARARAFERRLQAIGEMLYRALAPGGDDLLRDLVCAPGRRTLTIHTEDPEALSLPWELLHDGSAYLTLQGVMIRRELPAEHAARGNTAGASPLRVLLIVARPDDTGFIDPRAGAKLMLDALDAAGSAVRVELCDPPTLAELDRRLTSAVTQGEPYHVVHFDGHGFYLRDLGVSGLAFETEDAKLHVVPAPDLTDRLHRSGVRVVLLEACGPGDPSPAPVSFGVVSPGLVASGIGSVVAFSHRAAVQAGRILVDRFYQAIARGESVGSAVEFAQSGLMVNRERYRYADQSVTLQDWHIVQLYQSGPDFALLPANALANTRDTMPFQRDAAPSKDFDAIPMFGFHGRARELLRLQRTLRKHGAVAVTGGGGMGKSSLAREAGRWWHRTGLRPGGAAWSSFEGKLGVDRAVQGFVEYAEGAAFQPGSPEDLWQRAVGYFRERDLLWVWDNLESTLPQYQDKEDPGAFDDAEQEKLRKLHEELTRPGAKGWLLVTCRPDDTGLPGIAEMRLDPLGEDDALEMALHILEKKGIKVGVKGYAREDIMALLDAVGWHPLSIELVLPHCKAMKPAEVTAELRKVAATARQPAEEDRNRSLLASLRWSTERLSDEARGVLPYLAWFEGGAFEAVLEDFCAVGPEVWGRVREELLATALVRLDNEAKINDKPYLRFHPTLPYAADPGDVLDKAEAGRRFARVYYELAALVDKTFRGAEPAGAMAVMLREERNLRRAMALALEQAEYKVGVGLAETLGKYLQMAGRNHDQARLASWVQEHMAEASGPAKWGMELGHAWGLFLAGKGQEGVNLLVRQLREIEGSGGELRHRALCLNYLGRILYHAGRPQRALASLAEAVAGFEATGDRGNLAAALSDLANTLMALGRLTEALNTAEQGLTIVRERGDVRSEAAGLGLIAAILGAQHRFDEAERRYQEALEVAKRVGDGELEGATLQHIGNLAHRQGRHTVAMARYKESLTRFQMVGDRNGEMEAADLLGGVEADLGHYEAARAWYSYAERLARILGDERQLGATAHNLGILLQQQAMALPASAEDQRRHILGEAAIAVTNSIALSRGRDDDAGIAASLFQLGRIHLLLGDLDEAERCTQQALSFYEPHDLPDVYKVYWNLEDIATARNRPEEAAAWRAKKEAKIAELERLARGGGPPRLPDELRDAFLALCQTLHAARTAGQPLPPNAAETIADLAGQPEPLGAAGRFLQSIAGGALPDVPEDLPGELTEVFAALVRSLREFKSDEPTEPR